ncbi:MAG: DUF4838 domain-containing protein [Anaerolineae bacterium]
MKELSIRTLSNAKAVQFAAAELSRYIAQLTNDQVKPVVSSETKYNQELKESLWLLETAQLPDFLAPLAATLPQVADPRWDDAFAVDVTAGHGVILGGNAHSVLMGAYQLLAAAGCRWVRPGKDGEYIPQGSLDDLTLRKSEAASYRHRGICIEGACSYENIADIIDWAPKVGYNAYFTQFRESYTFFERWYSHRGNPNVAPEPFNVEMARDMLKHAQAEIAKRGMVYHAVGHGWTCEPLGIAGLGWDSKVYEVSPEVQSYLAEVNGVRAIWNGVPLNTNLCYSNPQVRKLIVESIADYAAANLNVDVIHFWLADDSNNQCECENCRKARPSDFYVQMLNELDAVMSSRGLATRIVFLIYVDLLWPPEKQRLINSERFILMFAPITRSYSSPFSTEGKLPEIPPYNRNKLKFPKNVSENVAFLRGWQASFDGDSFDFDYHLMWDHFNDPSYTSTAQILGEDAVRLHNIGLNGYMSCQLQRIFFPTALPMVVLGQKLVNTKASFEDIAVDYYTAAYGEAGKQVKSYLESLSVLFSPRYLRGELPMVNPQVAEGLAKIKTVVQAFQPVIAANRNLANHTQAKSWEYLAIHAEYCLKLAEAQLARARGENEQAKAAWQELTAYMWDQEPVLQPVFDTNLFVGTLNRRFM